MGALYGWVRWLSRTKTRFLDEKRRAQSNSDLSRGAVPSIVVANGKKCQAELGWDGLAREPSHFPSLPLTKGYLSRRIQARDPIG